jgi:type IV pilus assembly protein PilM
MAKSVAPTVGLDIGSSLIKVVELASGRDGVTVRAIGMAPTPPGCIENNIIVDPHLLGQTVKKLLKDSGVTSKSVVSSVAGQTALVVRIIEVPKMSDTELSETMKWEAERQIPFPVNEVIMDYETIRRPGASPDDQNIEVLMAAAQKDMIYNLVEMFRSGGLKPKVIDIQPLAVARPLIELGPSPWDKKTIAILNIGATTTDIGVYRDGILAFPRMIPLAGHNMTLAIMNQLAVDEARAEALKVEYGEVNMNMVPQPVQPASDAFLDFGAQPEESGAMPFVFMPNEQAESPRTLGGGEAESPFEIEQESSHPLDLDAPSGAPMEFGADNSMEAAQAESSQNLPATMDSNPEKEAVQRAIGAVLIELRDEIRRSLDYYRGRPNGSEINDILICGGGSRMKFLDQYFEREFGVPTRVANPFEYLKIATKNFSSEYLEDVAPLMTVAVGLAAREMVPTPDLPVVDTPKRAKRGKKK